MTKTIESAGPRTLMEFAPYREAIEKLDQLRNDLADVEVEIASSRNHDPIADQVATLLAGGSIEEIETGRAEIETLERKQQVLSKAVRVLENELQAGPLKGQARRAVCQTLEPEQRRLAGVMAEAIGDLFSAMEPIAEMQDSLLRDGCGITEPLRHLTLNENVTHQLNTWLANNGDYSGGQIDG